VGVGARADKGHRANDGRTPAEHCGGGAAVSAFIVSFTAGPPEPQLQPQPQLQTQPQAEAGSLSPPGELLPGPREQRHIQVRLARPSRDAVPQLLSVSLSRSLRCMVEFGRREQCRREASPRSPRPADPPGVPPRSTSRGGARRRGRRARRRARGCAADSSALRRRRAAVATGGTVICMPPVHIAFVILHNNTNMGGTKITLHPWLGEAPRPTEAHGDGAAPAGDTGRTTWGLSRERPGLTSADCVLSGPTGVVKRR
jgi:hypothetical protein